MLGDINPQTVRIVQQAVVYPGHNHVTSLNIKRYDGRSYKPVDLNDLTRVVLAFPGADPAIVFDSDTQAVFTWSGNVLTVDLSDYAMPESIEPSYLIVYDAEHPLGQVLVDDVDTRLEFDFRLVPSTGTTPPPSTNFLTDAPADGDTYGRKDGAWVSLAALVSGVSSVNGQSGTVVLTTDNVPEGATNLYHTTARAAAAAPVQSVNSQTGAVVLNAASVGAATAAQGGLADTAVQPGALSIQLDLKVDKVAGYGLSQENFTAAEKLKLAGLEGSHFKGVFANLAALQAAFPTASAGDYADVDAGVGSATIRYVWDVSDEGWQPVGSGSPLTAADIKVLYESNPDTNAYTDAEKSKLSGIAAGATANADTDSLSEGSTNLYHTAARVLATVLSGLSLATGTAITSSDSLLVAFGKLQKQITDLITTVGGKQDTLVSSTNIKTINGNSLLGSGNLSISGSGATWGGIGGTLADQTDLQSALDAKGLAAGMPYRVVTASGPITPADSGRLLICTNGTAITLTVGAEATATWSIAGVSPVVHLLSSGAGTVTVAGAAGVTVDKHASDSLTLDGQHAPAALMWRSADTWSLVGRLAAA